MTRATKNRQRVLGLAAAVTLALSACAGEGQSPEATDATVESATANQTQQSQPEPSDTEDTPTTDSEATPAQTASDAVAPNDARVLEALQEAGWTCQGESRCRTQADQGEAVIELSDQRAFIM
ncbi:hypothetical protein [Micrococcoides hystricis]|uniref:PASTA domain-containing protein n=1 Tax=Micrococcoides hystricis TaxID=1572761 RepID=A0ABV6P7P0_9MICC